MSEPIISLEQLSVGYQQELLKINELKFFPGQLTSVLGPNGIGKSTFLRTVGGLLAPLAGKVTVHDQDINELSKRELARKLSFVFTRRPNNSLRVEEIVGLGRFPWLGLLGKMSAKDKDIVRNAMDATDVSRFGHKELGQLSDGERQKVMIARALAQDGDVMLLDEPTAYLDAGNKSRIMRLLKSIAAEQGKCVVLTTHDVQLALAHSDRILIMHANGTWEGSPTELYGSNIISKAFGDDVIRIDNEGNVRYK